VGTYLVERFLVGWSAEEVTSLVHRLDAEAPRLAEHGVRHVESIVIAADETCLSLFEAPDAASVQTANTSCDLPFGRVLDATTHRTAP
jgi:hypothetical protein